MAVQSLDALLQRLSVAERLIKELSERPDPTDQDARITALEERANKLEEAARLWLDESKLEDARPGDVWFDRATGKWHVMAEDRSWIEPPWVEVWVAPPDSPSEST